MPTQPPSLEPPPPAQAEGARRPRSGRAPLGLSTTATSATAGLHEISISARYLRAQRARESILTRANLLDMQLREARAPYWCAFVTLTYARMGDWSAGHVTQFNERLREHLRRRGHAFPYVWCAELQQRGAVHFHQLVFLPRGTMLPKPDQQGWWTHGMTKIERARNAVPYIAKYAGKMIVAEAFPPGLRLTGAGGLSEYSRAHARYVRLPGYVRRAFPFGASIARAPGGGYMDTSTGEVVTSEWEFAGASDGALSFRRRTPNPLVTGRRAGGCEAVGEASAGPLPPPTGGV